MYLTRAESPVPAGKLFVVTGHGWGSDPADIRISILPDTQVSFPGQASLPGGYHGDRAIEVVQQHPEVLTLRLPDGPFRVCMLHPGQTDADDAAVCINRAELRWLSHRNAHAGQTVRAFGRGLVSLDLYPENDASGQPASYGGYVDGATRVAIRDSAGVFHWARIGKMSSYDVEFTMPEGLPSGRAEVYVHNGHGGQWGWSEPVSIEVGLTDAWPTDVFDVTDYGAVGDGVVDDGPAIQRACDAARDNGGGVVYFPRGGYRVVQTITAGNQTVLRGETRERCWIFFPDGFREDANNASAVIGIAGLGALGLEELSIHAVYCDIIAAAPLPADSPSPRGWLEFCWQEEGAEYLTADGCFIRRCRLLHNFTHLYHRRKNDPSFDNVSLIDAGTDAGRHATAFIFRGNDIDIADSEFQGKGAAGSIANCSYARVQRNRFHAGAHSNAFQMHVSPEVCRNIIFEDNILDAISQTHHGALWMMHGGYNMHFARNEVVRQFWVSDCEGLLGHMWGWRIPLFPSEVDATTMTVDIDAMDRFWSESKTENQHPWPIHTEEGYDFSPLVGHEVQIFTGPGLGQTNWIDRVDGTRVTFRNPWRVVPTAESAIVVHKHPAYRDLVFVDNLLEDTGPSIMLWGHAHECVIDGNRVSRAGLIGTYATLQAGFAAGGCHFMQIINNTMDEGRVRIIDQHEPGGRYAGGYITTFYSVFGGFKKMWGHNFVGYTVRNNLMLNDSTIRFGCQRTEDDSDLIGEGCPEKDGGDFLVLGFGKGEDEFDHIGVIIEDNASHHCKYGLLLGQSVLAVLRDNTFSDVDHPVIGSDLAGIVEYHPASAKGPKPTPETPLTSTISDQHSADLLSVQKQNLS